MPIARMVAVGSGVVLMAGLGLASPAYAKPAVGTNVPFTGTTTSVPFVGTSGNDTAQWSAVGDLSGNGPHDVAVVNDATDNIWAMLNNGSGQFTPKFIGISGSGPDAIGLGNFGGTGPGEDVAVANSGSNTVTIYLRKAGGYNAENIPVGAYPDSLAVGDLTNNGRQDIAVTNAYGNGAQEPGDPGSITLLLNQGHGNFTPDTFSAGDLGDTFQVTGPKSIAIGDLQGTGHAQDLAVLSGDNNLQLFLNNSGKAATPTYTTPAALSAGFDASSVAIGDLGGPGPGSDIAVADAGPAQFRAATLFLNQGDANFAPETIPTGITTFSFGSAIAIGDLDGSSRPGFAVTNPAFFGASVSVFIKGVSDGNFQETTIPGSPDSGPVTNLAMGNLTGDPYPNRLDIIVPEQFTDTLTLITNTTLVPTTLVAGALLNKAYPAYTANAVLLDTLGQPISGQTITFTTGTTPICQAVTSAGGLAKCQNLKVVAAETANKGYTATYAGSNTYQPGSDNGKLR